MTAATVLGSVGLAACSSGPSSSPSASSSAHATTTGRARASTTTGTSASTTVSTAGTSTASSTSGVATTSGLALCRAADLTGSLWGSSGAAGTRELTFALKNVSTASCQTDGYPGLLLLGSGGVQLPTDASRTGTLVFEKVAPGEVVLAPGATAWFNVGFSDVTTGGVPCSAATAVQIIPPDDVSHLVVPGVQITACDGGTIYTSALFGAGSAATQTTAPRV